MHTVNDQNRAGLERVIEYALERIEMSSPPLDRCETPEALQRRAPHAITPQGIGVDAVLTEFVDVLAPACLSTDHPRYLSFIPAAPTKTSLAFDLVVSASSMCASSWLEASGVVHAENEALRWLADLAGLPAGAGGCFVSGGSAGNLSALAVARQHGRSRALDGRRLRVAVGETAHSSIASVLNLLDMDAFIVPNSGDRLTGTALSEAINADPDRASIVAVAAAAGATNTGMIDDLAGIAAVAAESDLWMHVDGAYGAAALAAPSVRELFNGIELADSFIVDPHKWLFAPFDCCALIYRQPALASAVHAQHAGYLDAIHDSTEWNPTDYAFHLSRRARGLPFWFSLAVHGTDAYRDAIEASISLARSAAEVIEVTPYLDLVMQPQLSVVLFTRHGWEPNDYTCWSDKLLMDQRGFCLPTRWKGETVGRFVFINPRTTIEDVRDLIDSLGDPA